LFVCLLAIVNDVSNVFDVRMLGLNDDVYDDDPENPDYEEEPVDKPEGKSYRPLLDHVEPSFAKIKSNQQLNQNFY